MNAHAARQPPRPHWRAPPRARYLGAHDGDALIEITLVLRRRGDALPTATWPHAPPVQRADFGERGGADPAVMARLRDFAHTHGLVETGCQPHRRVLQLRGSAATMQRAFGVTLGRYQPEDGSEAFVGCAEPPVLPDGVIAVLGLDRRRVAYPHFRKPLAQPDHAYTPIQLGQLYAFPDGDGSGWNVAIIELGGGYRENDITAYFKSLGLARMPSVTAVSIAGGKNQPGGNADAEVMLDIEVVGALAPAAKLVVYFAPNTDQGFYEAISQAAHDTTHKPSIMSISWGSPEDSWSDASREAMQSALQDAAALGITVTVAAGDSGSSDGESDGRPHVDFPASSPYALACGGTRLVAGAGTIGSETVWNETVANEGATGGGVSSAFALPDWQRAAKVPAGTGGFAGRGVPDVAGDADPLTGYRVRVDGADQVIGGTSAVAPLWAALVARLNQSLDTTLADVHAAIYQIGSTAFLDITQGNNGDYKAGKGWDACTGWGSPDGKKLLDALTALRGGAGGDT